MIMCIYVKVFSKFNELRVGSEYVWKVDALVFDAMMWAFSDHIMEYSIEFTTLTFSDERNQQWSRKLDRPLDDRHYPGVEVFI